MRLTATVLESESQISQLILNQLKDIIDKLIKKTLPNTVSDIKLVVADALRNQPEYTSLMAGTLKAELGLPDSSVVDTIINSMVDSLNIEEQPIKISNKGLSGGFKLTMIKSDDISGLIFTDIAQVFDTKGYTLPWLEWLLLRGNDILVKEFSVKYTTSNRSRSGMAIMEPSDGTNWRVPAQFAGTQTNNWITRAIDTIETDIYNILINNLKKSI